VLVYIFTEHQINVDAVLLCFLSLIVGVIAIIAGVELLISFLNKLVSHESEEEQTVVY